MIIRNHWLCALLVVASQTAAATANAQSTAKPDEPRAADAQTKREAARRFEHALELYADADYALALAEFERVYELVPDYRVLYNLGQVYMQLGRYARAHAALSRYLKEGGSALPADRSAQVEADLKLVQSRTALLTVLVNRPGAEILLDGVVVGSAPLSESLVVDVGERRLQVRLSGYGTETRSFPLAGGDKRDVVIELSPNPAPSVVTKPKAPTEPVKSVATMRSEKPSPNYTWVGWTATGGLAVTAGIMTVLGASRAGELANLRDDASATREQLDSTKRQASTLLVAADVLGAAALVTGGVTLYFQLRKPHAREKPSSALAVELSPRSIALSFAR